MSKTKYPGVTRTPSGGIKYRGTTFAGFNKPKRSNRAGKKGMVLAKEGEKISSFTTVIALWDTITLRRQEKNFKRAARQEHSQG